MLVGVKAGGFTLENVVGSGGFGAVYFTRGEQGEPLAVKVLFPPRSRERADMADYTNRLGHFQREIHFAAGFRHPNIMRIHFSGSILWHYADSSENQPGSHRSGDYNLSYYVTDDLPDSVEQRLRSGLFTSAGAVEIGKQVCEALEALHGADPRILHLDLNPSNVRLAKGGRVVITDFGLVRVEGMPQGEVTRETSWIPPYVAAPEQRAGEDLDVSTDIYQVGALLFYLLTGKTRREFAVMTLLADRPDVPQSLATVIERCTRHEKEMRFQDAASVKEALVSANPSFIDVLRRLTDFLSRLSARVPPLWKNPVTWLLGAFSVFAFVWVLGIILPPSPITITIASSSTKKEWLIPAVKDFNEASRADASLQLNGSPIRLKDRPIVVEILLEEIEPGVFDHYRSGSIIADILSRDIEPTIASPAEQSWLLKLQQDWPDSEAEGFWSSKLGDDLSNDVLIVRETPTLLRTPLVIAMWESRATALGCWPISGPNCTWQTLRSLAIRSDGWGMFDRPEWGTFNIGYGQVGRSNSATFAQVLNCYSGLHKTNGLRLDEVGMDSGCGQAMQDLDAADPFIHEKSETVCQRMREQGNPSFLDACISYEKEVIETFIAHPELREPIVAVYPQDGTIAPTHPFAILGGAPWVSQEQARAAAVFMEFLLSDQQQSRLMVFGFRPSDPDDPIEWPTDASDVANSEANPVIVEIPDTQVIDAIVELWKCVRQGDCPG